MKNEKPGLPYIANRIKNILFPPLHLVPFPAGITIERNVAIPMRDGKNLRANIFRPTKEGIYPVIMSAHPYGKDEFNRKAWYGVRCNLQFRLINQPGPVAMSEWTSWEAPDPAFWVPKGYAVINIDLRGFGTSDDKGQGEVLSDQEAGDYFDCIEWAAAQPWSSGKVGLNGVSYLAISQYKVAALNPPHLAAICPWEGFSDFYKDLGYPGGVREDGFAKLWGNMVPSRTNVRTEQLNHPLRDEWYRAVTPDLSKITVPALVCGSFSDQCLHTNGSFRAFREISSTHKWLYTHRAGKWAAYYSPEAQAFQQRFFDYFLKGEPNGMLEVPPVKLDVMDTGKEIHRSRAEQSFPPTGTQWRTFYLDGATGQLAANLPAAKQETSFDMQKGQATFEWVMPEDLEITGQPVLKVFIRVEGASDLNLFAGLRKIRDGKNVPFEGSYGFGYDVVTKGWQKASLRKLDPATSQPNQPEHAFAESQPLQPGEIVTLEFSLLPSATFFKKGDVVRLALQGHWLFGTILPINGPAKYETSPAGTCTLFCGGDYPSQLTIPVNPV
ncbi:MAG: CocE/NonD family hydrolase [Chloroflexi bacterium]|nr:CocE/NonD family hydrolase [Chloroflexota bacterium]OJV94493.1 MAG: hypothetical protein BGO39_22360 [Chloroflexi bacterium 54-19]